MKKKDPTSHRIIEKRRRDRMNNCLADLSRLIPSHYMRKGRGRVEKTEIIEMAIRHLKDLRESSAGFQLNGGQRDWPSSPGASQDDFSYTQNKITTTSTATIQEPPAPPPPPPLVVQQSPVASCAMPLDCTHSGGLQQTTAISANASYMTDSTSVQNMALYHQPALINHHQSLAAASASLSMKQFQHQQYHNNERQINNRASEQNNNKYRNECCSCRGRPAARLSDSAINETSINHNNNQNQISSSSDQSDTGSMDYPSSSSGSNKTQTINKSTSESSSSGEGSPTSSSSSSSSSTGWYKKAWLIRSFSRSVSKN